jgi:glutaredoxin
MEVTLFSNHCPQCKYLTTLLNQKNIKYDEVNDEELMISMELMSMPQLRVNCEMMKYADALQWVNKQLTT